MNEPFPIVPPPELVQQWWAEENYDPFGVAVSNLANHAAQWGADHELEACCMWITREKSVLIAEELGVARRPKPPSLKEQALEQLGCIQTDLNKFGMGISTDTIRRALEALPND